MKLIASGAGVKELTLDGSPPIQRGKDGTFEVSDFVGKRMIRSSEFAQTGTTFRKVAQGFTCVDCGFASLLRDHCGKCGSTRLEAE